MRKQMNFGSFKEEEEEESHSLCELPKSNKIRKEKMENVHWAYPSVVCVCVYVRGLLEKKFKDLILQKDATHYQMCGFVYFLFVGVSNCAVTVKSG